MQMTTIRPTAPGWYWYELPGSWALQPVRVFNGGEPGELMYTLDSIIDGDGDDDLDGFWLSNASDDALWSDEPIAVPNDGGNGPSA
jgi:hypothetical protein